MIKIHNIILQGYFYFVLTKSPTIRFNLIYSATLKPSTTRSYIILSKSNISSNIITEFANVCTVQFIVQ